MVNISIQFHATRQELLVFVQECMREHGIRVVAVKEFPFDEFEAHEVSLDELPNYFAQRKFGTFAFSMRAPNLKVENTNDFSDRNPHLMTLEIGKRSRLGLKESWLGAATANRQASVVWEKIAKKLKAMTLPGKSGLRYTPAAQALQDEGVPMLSMVGEPLILGGKRKPQKSTSRRSP